MSSPAQHGADVADTEVATLPNGVRVLTIRLPQAETVNVSVFVRTGSQHESARLNGISHVVEHMAFKGTRERDCQRINLDAERLGADVNAHTDKDHTAFHMDGRARDTPQFVQMLGDIVLASTFPAAELERERQVILHELTEDEEDAMSSAYKLFDTLCYGEHPLAQPVIGSRRNIQRFTRDDLLGYVAQQYSAGNVVVAVAGRIDPGAVRAEAEAAFGGMPAGAANTVPPVAFIGGLRTRKLVGCAQTHAVLGFPIPSVKEDHFPALVAATVFGEGMSSPLLDEIRERRGLVYHAACSADVGELGGQFVIEASTSPEQVEEFFVEVLRLLAEHAERIDPTALERARNQLAVRGLRARERAARRLESAALDLFIHGGVQSAAQWLARVEAVTADQVRASVAQMLAARPAVALAGKIGKGLDDRLRRLFPRIEAST
jgi:predicted Zn-dependent peptidase